MSIVSRELSITYDTTTVGAGTADIIMPPFDLDKTANNFRVGFNLLVQSADEASFASHCIALETQFRTPRKKLTVQFNTTQHLVFDPALSGSTKSTGFNQQPTIRKVGSRMDTGRSRLYRVEIVGELPADVYSQAGRRDSRVNYTFTESGRARLFLSGVYTALGASSARDQFTANIDTYAGSLHSAFGGTWEGPFDRQEVADDTNKILTFSRAYEQLIYNQALGVLNDVRLGRQQLVVDNGIDAAGDTLTTNRLQTINVSYDVAVDINQTQDLVGLWTSTVKPFLIDVARQSGGARGMALVAQDPGYDWPQNRINARMTFLAVGASQMYYARVTTDDSEDFGVALTSVWEDGKPFSKHDFRGPQSLTRTITMTTRTAVSWSKIKTVGTGHFAASSGAGDAFGIFGANKPLALSFDSGGGDSGAGDSGQLLSITPPGPAGVDDPASIDALSLQPVLLGRVTSQTPIIMGAAGDPQLTAMERIVVERYGYRQVPTAPTGKPDPTLTGIGGSIGGADAGGGGGTQSGYSRVNRANAGG